MSELQPRRSGGVSRRDRAGRAYTLVKVTGGLAVLTVALIVLAVLGIVGGGWAVVAALLTAGSGFLVRRTLK
jgi:hypothetical protein